MSKYLIQDKTMTTMANHMRRISGTEDDLTGAEIAEIFSRTQGTVKITGKYKVEAVNFGGSELKSGNYDTGEVFALPRTCRDFIVQGQNGWETIATFKGWSATAPITSGYVVVDDTPIMAGATMELVDDLLYICIEITEPNTTAVFNIDIQNMDIVIDWGDDYADTPSTSYMISHTYANIGSYIIKIPNTKSIDPLGGGLCHDDVTTPSLVKYLCIPTWCQNGVTLIRLSNLEVIIFDGDNTVKNILIQNCPSLNFVCLPSNMTEMSDWMFSNISYTDNFGSNGFKKTIIPYGVTEIPRMCFFGCDNLTDIIFPKSIISIGEYAFCNCSSLKNIILPNSPTVCYLADTSAFSGTPSNSSIYVPDNLVNVYKTDTNWSVYASRIKPFSKYTEK